MRSEVIPAGDRLPANGSEMPAVLAGGGAVQQMRGSYATAVAVQRPRNLAQAERRLLEEARLGGEEFYYGWSAGRERIEGPSVQLALAAARCWGNCAVELEPVTDLADSWVFTATFVDLETGFTLARQFRQSKTSAVHGKLDDDRKADIRFQVGQSKAMRNVVLNSLPASLVRAAMDEAKKGVRAKIESFVREKSLPAAVDLVLKALAKHGVKEERVLAKCGVADKKAVTIDTLVILRGDLQAVESGQERAEALFPEAEPAAAEAKPERKARRPPVPKPATPTQIDDLLAVAQRKGWGAEEIGAHLTGACGLDNLTDLTDQQAAEVAEHLRTLPDAPSIDEQQQMLLADALRDGGADVQALLRHFGVPVLSKLPAARLDEAMAWVEASRPGDAQE